jgi:hypothetical protein
MIIAAKTGKLGRGSSVPETIGMHFFRNAFFAPVRFRANLNPNSSNLLNIEGKTGQVGQVTFLPVRPSGKNRPVPIFPTTLLSD